MYRTTCTCTLISMDCFNIYSDTCKLHIVFQHFVNNEKLMKIYIIVYNTLIFYKNLFNT